MAENIEKTIYKLELDDSAYTAGIERLSASTNKFTQSQDGANNTLKQNEAALKSTSEFLAKAKKDLDDYTGSNERYRKQLQDSVKSATADQTKLTDIVNNNRKAYEAATKAAQDFATTSAKAADVQARTPGGKIGIPLPVPGGITAQIASKINTVEFADNIQIIEQTKQEFDALRDAIELAEVRMKQLNSTDEEFKSLAIVVEEGRVVLSQYEEVAKLAASSTGSLKGQISAATTEFNKMEQSGKATVEQLVEQEKKIVKLKQAYGDQTERLKVLSSQTRGFDFGKASIQTAISAFQTYASITILAGGANEELQKKTLQLFAAMQLLTSLEVLAKSVRKESTIVIGLQTAAQATYTAVVGASTGALKAFRLALLATGIGAAVVVIGFLVNKLSSLANAAREAGAQQKLLKEINDKAIDSYAGQVVKLGALRNKLNDLTVSQKDRILYAKEYNTVADESNKIDLKQIDNIGLLNGAIDRQIGKIKERALATAAESIVSEKAAVFLKEQADFISKFPSLPADEKSLDKLEQYRAGTLSGRVKIPKPTEDQVQDFVAAIFGGNLKSLQRARAELNRAANISAGLTTTPKEDKPEKEKKTAATKQGIENDFKERKAALEAQIRELSRSEFETKVRIEAEYAEKLIKARADIQKLKSVTAPQKEELLRLAGILNQGELQKALADFNKKVIDARQKLTDELHNLQDKNIQDQLNLIQDEFDRRAKLIDFNEKKSIEDSKDATEKRLKALNLDRLLIGEEAYQEAKIIIVTEGEIAVNNILAKYAGERQDLSADLFKNSLDNFQSIVNEANLSTEEDTAKKIRQQSDRFLAGKITFEQFQKELTKIQKKGESDRRNSDLQDARTALSVLETKIAETEDKTSDHYKNLIKQRDDFRKKIAADEKEDAIKDAGDDPNKKRKSTVTEYAEAIGAVADSIIQFWQKANEAESKALDRSISLQEKRVEAAQRIASRGNAQYLKEEEDRLKELNIKRENAARKQLGIDAALQASQILVAITGAIAKIANPVPGAGIAETIASIAVIIGSLATGYGLVKSLQGNQPKLAKGKKYVTRDGHPSGTDTIPAWLNEGEAVIPTATNRAYHPTVAAIYDGTIPAEHMNSFVNAYHRVKGVPMPNYTRIGDAANMSISADGKMAVLLTENNRKLDESNELSRQTLRAMKNMSVSANIDRDGVAIMVNEYVNQMKIDKRV